jgi:hypothetical protein
VSASPSAVIAVSHARDPGRLAALREEWTALFDAAPSPSPFLSWEWLHAWWRHFGGGRRAWIVEARDPAGRLAGALALCGRPGLVAAALEVGRAATHSFAAAEHLHVVGDDLGRVAILPVLVLPLARAQPAFDVDRPALLEVLAGNLRQAPEERDAMPLGRFLHLAAGLVLPPVGRRNGDVGDRRAVRGVTRLRVAAQVADQDDFIHGCHVFSSSDRHRLAARTFRNFAHSQRDHPP